ncbi:MAG: 4Fe-4S dicluster domain-containing protein [Syntrophaceae bacterium]|nr:4Fe-4S dicluster domain-containing protein [Syntrophaceae bacterium]
MQLIHHGPGKAWVKMSTDLLWPVITAGKRLSNVPVLKWLIRPFFMRPYNEITTIPIHAAVEAPGSVVLPRRIVDRLLEDVDDIFILDECICRAHYQADSPPRTIGCIALGPAIRRIHPSHGRTTSTEEAKRHVDRAARAGLIANIAHVWIDPVAFGTRFRDLIFICLCDDTHCLYRTHMKHRGPTLAGAYQRLPGLSVSIDRDLCLGCGECVEKCFLADIRLRDGKAEIGGACAGCGRCVEVCPNGAAALTLANEEVLYGNLVRWIRGVSELPLRNPGVATE